MNSYFRRRQNQNSAVQAVAIAISDGSGTGLMPMLRGLDRFDISDGRLEIEVGARAAPLTNGRIIS